MAARTATWIAIVIGGGGGAFAALAGPARDPIPPAVAVSSLPMKPIAQMRASTPAAGAVAPEPGPAGGASQALAAATATASAAPPASAAPLPAAELLPLPTTKEALLRQEMHCDQRKADACIVAARALEGGSTGVTDAEKAAKYRRIALTALISQCDHNSPVGCGTLATMYRAGSGVPQSDRNADALVARARELCRFNDAPACHEAPLAP